MAERDQTARTHDGWPTVPADNPSTIKRKPAMLPLHRNVVEETLISNEKGNKEETGGWLSLCLPDSLSSSPCKAQDNGRSNGSSCSPQCGSLQPLPHRPQQLDTGVGCLSWKLLFKDAAFIYNWPFPYTALLLHVSAGTPPLLSPHQEGWCTRCKTYSRRWTEGLFLHACPTDPSPRQLGVKVPLAPALQKSPCSVHSFPQQNIRLS